MKKVLLGTTALLGVGTLAGTAIASDGIKLDVGGFFRTAYMLNFDDDGEGDLGNDRNTDGFFSDAEVHFKGEVTLDNGLTAGARIELEGETNADPDDDGNADGDQIDEAYIYFSGGFGEVRVGSDDEALAAMCVTPPGGTTNFGAFSPNQWAANTSSSNFICSGVDDRGDAQKIVYFTPNFSGFQLGLSYTPNSGDERQTDTGGPHVGMPTNVAGESRHNISAYATYAYEGDGWGLTWGGGGAWEGHVEQAEGSEDQEQGFYQTGLNLSFGAFKVGAVAELYSDIGNASGADAWAAGGGASYNVDAWTVGVQYSYFSADQTEATGNGNNQSDSELHQQRVALTGNYDMGPGISLDAALAYTWSDVTNLEGSDDNRDNYDAFEIGIGTAFSF